MNEIITISRPDNLIATVKDIVIPDENAPTGRTRVWTYRLKNPITGLHIESKRYETEIGAIEAARTASM